MLSDDMFNEENGEKVVEKVDENGASGEVDKNGDDWTELDKDGWENVLGSGRLRRRIVRASVNPGSKPQMGDVIRVDIKGSFDGETFVEKSGFEFSSQEAEVIAALDLVVSLMHAGETDEFVADPELAFGEIGLPPTVPPNAAVHYEVTLVGFETEKSPPEIPLEKRMDIGMRKKECGNFWYARSNHSMAVQCYRKAGEYFDDESVELDVPLDRYELPDDMQELLNERIKTYNNLAQAQMKLEAWDSALASLKQVLKIEPNNEKALFRKAKALTEKENVEEAIGLLRRVTRLYPSNKLSQIELQRLLQKQVKSRQVEENMSKKMLGLDKYEEELAKKKERNWRFKKSVAVVSLLVVFLAGLVAWMNSEKTPSSNI